MMELPQCHGNVAKATQHRHWYRLPARRRVFRPYYWGVGCLRTHIGIQTYRHPTLLLGGWLLAHPHWDPNISAPKMRTNLVLWLRNMRNSVQRLVANLCSAIFDLKNFKAPTLPAISSMVATSDENAVVNGGVWVTSVIHIYSNEQPTACRKRLLWFMTCGKQHSFVEPNSHQPPHFPLATRRATDHEIYAENMETHWKTDRNKPAVWAATPREAGWIWNMQEFMTWWVSSRVEPEMNIYVSSCETGKDQVKL